MAATPSSSTSAKRTSKKDDVEALLSDLDNLNQNEGDKGASSVAKTTSISTSTKADDAQSLLDDLDDLVKRRAPTPKKPSLLSRNPSSQHLKSTPRRLNSGSATPTLISTNTLTVDGGLSTMFAAGSSQSLEEADLRDTSSSSATNAAAAEQSSSSQPSWGGWWNSATKLADQARMELEKRAAQVQSQVAERARGATESSGAMADSTAAKVPWQIAQNVNSFIKNNKDLNKLRADLGKAGLKGWNELMNVVVPPIEKHEVLSITLSHDMVGFDGIGDVVFAVLQKVMESHASSTGSEQQLVVNKAPDRKSSSEERTSSDIEDGERNMKAVTGFEQGWKLAESKLLQLISSNEPSPKSHDNASSSADSITLPITTCPIYIRIQPVLESLPGSSSGLLQQHSNPTHLFLEILLKDPSNALTHKTISQPVSKSFIDLDFEDYPWVEELLSESLQTALGSIALEYIQGRNLGTSIRADTTEVGASEGPTERNKVQVESVAA